MRAELPVPEAPRASERAIVDRLMTSDHPRNLADTDSKAVTPISPAAQKFHRLIRCNRLDSSVTLSDSSVPLTRGKCHIADPNQHMAEAPPAMIIAVSMRDFMIHPGLFDNGQPLCHCAG